MLFLQLVPCHAQLAMSASHHGPMQILLTPCVLCSTCNWQAWQSSATALLAPDCGLKMSSWCGENWCRMRHAMDGYPAGFPHMPSWHPCRPSLACLAFRMLSTYAIPGMPGRGPGAPVGVYVQEEHQPLHADPHAGTSAAPCDTT